MGVHLILVLLVVAALHTAQAEVVGRHLVGDAQRELRLQQCILRSPVNGSLEVDAVGIGTFI